MNMQLTANTVILAERSFTFWPRKVCNWGDRGFDICLVNLCEGYVKLT